MMNRISQKLSFISVFSGYGDRIAVVVEISSDIIDVFVGPVNGVVEFEGFQSVDGCFNYGLGKVFVMVGEGVK